MHVPPTSNTIDNPYTNPFEELQNALKNAVSFLFPDQANDFEASVVVPPPHISADYSFAAYKLGASLEQDPTRIAGEICAYLRNNTHPLIRSVDAIGPYVNIVVDKSKFSEQALNYMHSRKDQFGTEYLVHESHLNIHYILPADAETGSIDVLRMFLIGRVIDTIASKTGAAITHEGYALRSGFDEYFPQFNFKLVYQSRDAYTSEGKDIVSKAVDRGTAGYIPGTNAITLNLPGASFVLQKNNGEVTDLAKDIAYFRNAARDHTPTRIVIVCLQNQIESIIPSLECARALEYLPSGIPCSIISLHETNTESNATPEDTFLLYGILGTPLEKRILLPQSEGSAIIRVLGGAPIVEDSLKNHGGETVFSLMQTLIRFPNVLAEVQASLNPMSLCEYLDELVTKTSQVSHEPRISQAIYDVLENGFKYLGLQVSSKELTDLRGN